MRLFLASSGDKTLRLLSGLAGITPSETRVAFIANAADTYNGDKWWVESDRNKLVELGYSVSEMNLEEMDEASFMSRLSDFDMIHVCGGNTIHLLRLLQRRGLFDPLKKAIIDSGKIYSGTSAGSMITAPNVELEKYSDENEPGSFADMTNFDGLGLVDFLIMPHAGSKDFEDDYIRYIGHLPEHKDPLIFLYDDQVVWVEDESIKILHA